MSIELVCTAPAFLDLTFEGLRAMPLPGREEFATALHRTPGGGAINAIGAARLGLRTAAAFPLGDDDAGRFLRAALEREGITVAVEPSGRTAVTVVMPVDGDRAMATHDPETPPDPTAVAALAPERVLCAIDQLELVPADAQAFVALGDRELDRYPRSPALPQGATLFANATEAAALTGHRDIEAAARALAADGTTVVITRGAAGAIAAVDELVVEAPGVGVEAVDTTGAGDLLAAAWVWGTARGLDVEARLRWAVLYAALSVTVPTATAGAVPLQHLLAEGARRGLAPPVGGAA